MVVAVQNDSDKPSLGYGFAKRHQVLLAETTTEQAQLIHVEKLTPLLICELRRKLACPLNFSQVSSEEFHAQLEKTYQSTSAQAMQAAEDLSTETDLMQMVEDLPKTEDLLEGEDDAPIIRLLNAMFAEAIKKNASDIHIEPFEDNLLVRFRIDGVLKKVLQPQRALASLIVSRIKVMAKLDIAEKRLPQDGRIALRIAGRAIDVRVSTIPTSHGERVVLRILDKKSAQLNLTHLGMADSALSLVKKIIAKPHGIFLITGPTGAGKTTTLYAILSELNSEARNILTVEDPIEYYLPGIGQTQVNSKANMTFAKGLRAILRQDPDIVMVGEIRDLETAEIAVQASLTGHLVLSTLHTNTAIGAITRLKDMGIELFLLSSSLIGVAAQRLVRLLCEACKKPLPASEAECITLGVETKEPPIIYHAEGCKHCMQTGYSGRNGIYEIIMLDDKLRKMIAEGSDEKSMQDYAHQSTSSIHQDGQSLVLAGKTTLEEILRVTSED